MYSGARIAIRSARASETHKNRTERQQNRKVYIGNCRARILCVADIWCIVFVDVVVTSTVRRSSFGVFFPFPISFRFVFSGGTCTYVWHKTGTGSQYTRNSCYFILALVSPVAVARVQTMSNWLYRIRIYQRMYYSDCPLLSLFIANDQWVMSFNATNGQLPFGHHACYSVCYFRRVRRYFLISAKK